MAERKVWREICFWLGVVWLAAYATRGKAVTVSSIASYVLLFSLSASSGPCQMSGKAPPTGPRALRASLPPGSAPGQPPTHPHHHQLQHPSPPSRQQSSLSNHPLNSRFSSIPTGPRSLVNGLHRAPPTAPKQLLNSSHYSQQSVPGPSMPNGISSHAIQSGRHPISINGKRSDPASGRSDSGVITFLLPL